MPLRRIVIGVDGSPGAAAALRWCAETGAVLDAEVVAVNALATPSALLAGAAPGEIPVIVDASAIDATVHDELAAELEQWCGPLREAGISYRSYVVDGGVVDALLGVAEEVDADLVVVGRSHGGIKEKLLGSVPNHLLHHCPCPVVIVPSD